MGWGIRGLIEGFYGRPWTWDERRDVMAWCAQRRMSDYVYAPKDDPLHRERWREPYGADDLRGFESLVASDTLRVGFGISPGLSIDYDDAADRAALASKVDRLLDVGVRLVCLALDDIPPRPGLGEQHARLTTWLHDHLGGRADLVFVPTEYTGLHATPYLDALAEGIPVDVPIAWTGRTVVCDEITADEAHQRAQVLGGRPPLIWDNYPVNDALMGDRLFLGPLRGREPGLVDACSGFVANPMVQPRASTLPLASIAGYLRGEDPEAVWETEADDLGVRAFAEACDAERPRQLVEAVMTSAAGPALDELDQWLDAVDATSDECFAGEAVEWLEQARREVGVARQAVELLRTLSDPSGQADREGVGQRGMLLAMAWLRLRRAKRTVFGPRRSFRPVISQWEDGSWRYHAESLEEDRNAVDALVRFALAQLDAWQPPR